MVITRFEVARAAGSAGDIWCAASIEPLSSLVKLVAAGGLVIYAAKILILPRLQEPPIGQRRGSYLRSEQWHIPMKVLAAAAIVSACVFFGVNIWLSLRLRGAQSCDAKFNHFDERILFWGVIPAFVSSLVLGGLLAAARWRRG